VLAERSGFFQNADLDIAEISAGIVVGFHHPRERDRSR